MATPRSADDDEFWVSERDHGSEDSADGLAQDVSRGRRLGARAADCGEEPVYVDGRRSGLPQAELAEYLDERNRLALRAGRDEVRNLAGQAAMPAPYLAVTDDRTAQSLAEEEIGEVVQGGGAGVVTFGPRRPVHVVIDGDRSVDMRRQDLDGIEFAEQERCVRQLDQPAVVAVYRIGGAHHRQARGQVGAVPCAGCCGPQGDGDVVRPAGRTSARSARDTVSP